MIATIYSIFGLGASAYLTPAETQIKGECVSMWTDVPLRPFYSGDAEDVVRSTSFL
jgi:hypothetical protein